MTDLEKENFLLRRGAEFVAAKEGVNFDDGLLEADEEGAGDDGVADVEGADVGHFLDVFADVGVVEAVAGVDAEAKFVGVRGGVGVARDFLVAGAGGGSVGIGPGVELDNLGAGAVGGVDLGEFGVDEGADADFRGVEIADDVAQAGGIAGDVEAAFGGDFLAAFGHEADFVRAVEKRLLGHGVGRGHFEIERDGERGGELAHVVFLDMAAILAQMDGDRFGTGLFADACGGEDAGLGRQAALPIAVARLAQRGDVVDVEAEGRHG